MYALVYGLMVLSPWHGQYNFSEATGMCLLLSVFCIFWLTGTAQVSTCLPAVLAPVPCRCWTVPLAVKYLGMFFIVWAVS